ncbi:MAG TPA: SDR family NAD(P)-dependent oxidoreductase [Solirubrobacteraceae bacterium]|nr:SDR family NAD(P)-dependent oxidoreductase [Solirubrobacteraceae bacterium]
MRITPGTRALVTGASRGIGRALAEALAARGATVGLAARSAGELDALAAALPGTHRVLPCDVGDAESVRAAVDGFAEAAGGLDLLIANAGITHYRPFREQPLAEAEAMTRVNWLGTLYAVHFGLPHLLDAGRGHVVVMSSGAGLRSFPGAAVYGATKAAQRMFAEALRHELDGTGVSLTTVYPGEIATSLHDHEHDRLPAWYRGGPRALPAAELADKILAGVEADARSVFHPPVVRLLGVLHNASPRASDALLRRLRGRTAAPRRD